MVGWWKSLRKDGASWGRGLQLSVHEFLIATSEKRGYQQNDKKPTTLTANAAAVDPWQQQAIGGDMGDYLWGGRASQIQLIG